MVCFARAYGDAFERLKLAEEVFDEVTPLVHLGVDFEFLGAAGAPHCATGQNFARALTKKLRPGSGKPSVRT